jgi:hypothetical protein
MSWATRMAQVPGDPGVLRPVLKPKQSCSECNEALVPEFKGNPRVADTWFWPECSECGEPMCHDCTDRRDDPGHEGERICATCVDWMGRSVP